MAVSKQDVHEKHPNEVVVEKAKDFWTRYNKPVTIVAVLVILIGGGFYVYKNYFKNPEEKKANEALWMAENRFKKSFLSANPDSIVKVALNGDPAGPGFLRVISKYKGTAAANLAKLYAGESYLILNDNVNAVKYLKDFSTDSKFFQARAYKLLGDAYADQGKDSDAFDYYKKAANHFKEDADNSKEALFLAAYLAQTKLNKTKEAIDLYKELLDKYPDSDRAFEAQKNLGRLGVYSNNEIGSDSKK